MKGRMDGAEENAHDVAQQILPESPHHLSLSFDRRFPRPDAWTFSGPSSSLQYMTYISAAQRGILTTRAAFEISDETPPPPMPVKALAKGEPRKKLSLMDYQNRKKSASPVENGLPTRTESRTNGAVTARSLPSKDDVTAGEKTHAPPRPANAGPEKPRAEVNGERSKVSQTKPQPDPESRKRTAEASGEPSPRKRTKSDVGMAKAEQSRPAKPGTPRGREGAEKPAREIKAETLHPTVNGLPPLSADRDREHTASPKSTIQVNGSRPRSDSGTSTPRKPESIKAALPQLLSPLHPSLFEGESEREDMPKHKTAGKASKPEKEKAKKFKIPELLSPTLPPVIEEILALRDRKPTTASKGVSSQSSGHSSDSPSGARKTIVAALPGRTAEEEERPSRPSRIVTFKLKKANAKRAKELLSLPSKSTKDALKKERSESADAAPPPAKKRPRPAEDPPQESAASKRPKISADVITARPAGSRTPLKHAAPAMSRVASSQSQGQGNTPAATTGLTPSTSDNRPPTRSEPLDPKVLAQVDYFKDRHTEYSRLGSKLKHARDDMMRDRGTNPAAADERRISALHFEMVLAYMVAFDSLNQSRILERKVCEISAWESLLPHLAELRGRVQANRALKALAMQMHALCLEQISNAFATLDPAGAAATFGRWTKHHRNRTLMWGDANATYERVEEPKMRVVMGPWTAVDDAVAAVLDIMRRWAEKDGVRWQPEVNVKGGKDREREREKVPDKDRENKNRDKERARDRFRDREKDRERERERDRDRDRERDRDRDRERDRDRDRDRERDKERDRPRHPANGSKY
ncbi:hypothetical protein VTG60DRAFT_2211 [Thermothelomyces hinnuleus]